METLILLKPDWHDHPGSFMDVVRGLTVIRFREIIVPAKFWAIFFKNRTNREDWKKEAEYLSSSPSGFILVSGDCLKGCVIEKAKASVAKLQERYKITQGAIRDIAYTCMSDEDAKWDIKLVKRFFPKSRRL